MGKHGGQLGSVVKHDLHNCGAFGFDRARILATISLLGLDAEHGKRAARLRSEFIDGKAEALVSSCLDVLTRNQDFSLVERSIGAESFKQSWIHHLRDFGQNFDAPRYFEDRFRVKTLSEVAGAKIDEVFIGSCMTNIGHFRAASKLLENKRDIPVKLWVAPP